MMQWAAGKNIAGYQVEKRIGDLTVGFHLPNSPFATWSACRGCFVEGVFYDSFR